jgi:hypothetical protein
VLRGVGGVLLSWWLFLLVAFGLAGNGLFLFKAWQAGNVPAVLLFASFLICARVYLYRTYNARDEIRGNMRD